MTSSMPLSMHTAPNVTQTQLLCNQLSFSERYSIVPKPSVAKNRLETIPTVAPASTSICNLCLPVATKRLATSRSTIDAAKEAIVARNSSRSRALVNRWSWMLGKVA